MVTCWLRKERKCRNCLLCLSFVITHPDGDNEFLHHVLHCTHMVGVDSVTEAQPCEQPKHRSVDAIADDYIAGAPSSDASDEVMDGLLLDRSEEAKTPGMEDGSGEIAPERAPVRTIGHGADAMALATAAALWYQRNRKSRGWPIGEGVHPQGF